MEAKLSFSRKSTVNHIAIDISAMQVTHCDQVTPYGNMDRGQIWLS